MEGSKNRHFPAHIPSLPQCLPGSHMIYLILLILSKDQLLGLFIYALIFVVFLFLFPHVCEFRRETGLILRCNRKVGNPFQTKQRSRPSCRDQAAKPMNTGVGCHFLPQGRFPAQEWNPSPLESPASAGGFFTTEEPGRPILIDHLARTVNEMAETASKEWMAFV